MAAPLSARHRRSLARLFPIWETRNGSRAKELNLPAFVYIETHGGTAIGGSDDHAGIDIGRTFTETPRTSTPQEFLAHVRGGCAFLGWLSGEDLARAYASADVFLFPSQTDTFGQVILEAQASGLPVVAVHEGGPASLVEHGETGLLAPPDAGALADQVLALISQPLLRGRIRRGGLWSVRGRTWEAALEQLAAGYRAALEHAASDLDRNVA